MTVRIYLYCVSNENELGGGQKPVKTYAWLPKEDTNYYNRPITERLQTSRESERCELSGFLFGIEKYD